MCLLCRNVYKLEHNYIRNQPMMADASVGDSKLDFTTNVLLVLLYSIGDDLNGSHICDDAL